MPRRPSILLVFADQMRGRDIAYAGNTTIHTPTLDAMAADGVVCSQSYASVPVCTPNRATLLSAQYAVSHRVIGNDLPMPEAVHTIGEVAHEAGYRTGYVGKWHLDGVPRSRFTPPGKRRHGFDFWAVYNCSHAYFRPRYYRDTPRLIEVDGYEPIVQTDIALEFLDDLDAQDEFLLVLSWGPPHDPYDQVPQQYRELYDPDDLTLPPNVIVETTNPLAARLDPYRTFADYYAAITALDEQLGRLLDRLDRLGRGEDTLVVFTSDHGDMLWAHGLMKKQAPWQESIHVPLVLRWPAGLPAGVVRNQLVATVDLAPTLASLVSLPISDQMQGADLSGPLCDDSAGPDSVLLSNPTILPEGARQGMPEWRAIRTERYTYAEQPGRRPWLLFDNVTDPWQMSNLIDDPQCRQTKDDLAYSLGAWLDATRDPFLPTEQMVDHVRMREAWESKKRGFEATGPLPERATSR